MPEIMRCCFDQFESEVKLAQEFDPRRNALNAWRLTMALGVILWHSFGLTGRHVLNPPLHQFLSDIWVDGFFAISGFLITSSWLHTRRRRDYFAARGLRILPGLWVCLIVTAFVIAPVSAALQGHSPAKLILSGAPLEYIVKNSAVLQSSPMSAEHRAGSGFSGFGTVRCGRCPGKHCVTSLSPPSAWSASCTAAGLFPPR